MSPRIACLGCGLIGKGWVVNFILKGYEVRLLGRSEDKLNDVKDEITKNMEYVVNKKVITSEHGMHSLSLLTLTTDLMKATENVQFVQENLPENYEIKKEVLYQAEKFTDSQTIFASSTSGLLISEIAKDAMHPERFIGAHPYAPVPFIPLVEVSKSEKTSGKVVDQAINFFCSLGKEPILLKKEALGFISNRLQLALYREAIDLVMNGVCSVEEVDKAVLYGPGLRYAVMGPNLIWHLGGGQHGIKGVINHIGPSANLWLEDMASWKKIPDEWADIAQEGVLEAIQNRPAESGQSEADIITFRDDMLLELLKMHHKI